MKAIDLSASPPTLAEVLRLAGEDNVILRTPDGRQFVLAEIDDFADEVRSVRQNEALTQLLDERSRETTTFPLSKVREQLQGKRRGKAKGTKGKGGSRPL
jgi:hypothetical protein